MSFTLDALGFRCPGAVVSQSAHGGPPGDVLRNSPKDPCAPEGRVLVTPSFPHELRVLEEHAMFASEKTTG